MSYLFPDGRIIVFAKAPVSGEVKTRLHGVLSPQRCAELQSTLIAHTLHTTTSTSLCPVELWSSDAKSAHSVDSGKQYGLAVQQQQSGDLGQRMQHAFSVAFKQASYVLLIGCDCPALNPAHLQQCLQILQEKQAPIVLIPAEDGGYVLIGLRSEQGELFQDVGWGSNQVLAQTRKKIEQLRLRHVELDALWDLDRPQDLARLKSLPDKQRWESYIDF